MFEINFDDLTIGDLEDIEEITGGSMQDIDWGRPSMKVLRAIIYVTQRRGNPDFTMEDARNFKPADIQVTNPTADEAAS